MQVVLALCSHAVTPLFNTALWPFLFIKHELAIRNAYNIWKWGWDVLLCNDCFVCFLSATDFSWLLAFAAWVDTGGSLSLACPQPHPPFPPPCVNPWVGSRGSEKAREQLGRAERSLLAWPESLLWSDFMNCVPDPWDISWRLCTSSEDVLGSIIIGKTVGLD